MTTDNLAPDKLAPDKLAPDSLAAKYTYEQVEKN